ncbi:hypothetical protein [Niastella populi]|uniref:TonB-dependent receptor-like beta-barrel domain-containing protein n=1 Tax=Niastella populi TaxID=550983 RepID=A0A1V9FVA8_9BACT|nr:hypothetical protein [Niastella populi]OQP62260.1 hypothetical protein A4R26_18485 [Niastella populi]
MNDGNTPNSSNAPDLFKWDTTRYTNFRKLLIGGTANIHNAHISVSGGSNTTQYLLSASYRKETTVFPGKFADQTFYSHASLLHRSKNNAPFDKEKLIPPVPRLHRLLLFYR